MKKKSKLKLCTWVWVKRLKPSGWSIAPRQVVSVGWGQKRPGPETKREPEIYPDGSKGYWVKLEGKI